MDVYQQIERDQRRFCSERSATFALSPPDSKLGFATSTAGKTPIKGLRHSQEGGTCGWYIWCGEDLSDAPDFFLPLCVKHVYESHPEVRSFLGLPPGYRFLLAGDHCDVWYDATLLTA
jgi:hypothetical protein